MNGLFAIRREDKNRWERRTPLVPEHIEELINSHGLSCVVQPSPIRVFEDREFIAAGARIDEDVSECRVVFAVKEIPLEFFREGGTYVFFSHTIKGQEYNMPMLARMMELNCTLIDYEKVADAHGQRLIFFGRYAGLAGMLDTLWALGRRLRYEGLETPFAEVKQALEYHSLEEAKSALTQVGTHITEQGLPEDLAPFICGFSGYGNVSRGAQEIYDLLPVQEITPAQALVIREKGTFSRNYLYKVVFKEEHIVEPVESDAQFDLQEYYDTPVKYRSQFDQFTPHLNVLVNAIYWDERYPRLVTKEYLKKLFANKTKPHLRVIGDITCDVEGSIECTVRATQPDNPVFVYNPENGSAVDGVEGRGVVVLGVDNLPCELPRDASHDFSVVLKKFVPDIVGADYTGRFEDCALPEEIKRAVITYRGELTPQYTYLQENIS